MNINEFCSLIASYKSKCLTTEEEAQLVLTIQRGEDRNGSAQNTLIEANKYWAGEFVRKYQFAKMELEDLWSLAVIGLWKSIDAFDLSIGVPFHKYAENRMRSYIWEEIGQYGSEFNLPRPIQIKKERLRKVIPVLTQRLGYEPTPEDLAKEMGLSAEEIQYLQCLNQRFKNVDDLNGKTVSNKNDDDINDIDNEEPVGELPDRDNTSQSPSETFRDFCFLPPLDREILVRSHGLLGHSPMPHAEILDDLNGIRKAHGKSLLTIQDVQAHYNRAVLLDRCQE